MAIAASIVITVRSFASSHSLEGAYSNSRLVRATEKGNCVMGLQVVGEIEPTQIFDVGGVRRLAEHHHKTPPCVAEP